MAKTGIPSVDSSLRQSKFMTAVLNTVRSLVLVLDRRGRIVHFNRACEETTGYSFQEVAGKPFWNLFLTKEDRDKAIKIFSNSLPEKLANRFETVWLTKNGEKRLIEWSHALIFDERNFPEHIIGTGIDITEHRQLERMVLDVAKREQRRLGQELHDGLAQHLASTAVAAKVLEQKLTRASSPAARELKRVVQLLNQAVSQTRKLAQGLYMLEMQPEELAPSLKKLAWETERAFGIRCSVRIAAGFHVSDRAMAMHLYRTAREAVNNAVKHGRCKNIRIELKKKKVREGELSIENDGRTFSGRHPWKGLGLRIMRSRAAILKAGLEVSAGARGGTVVRCVFSARKGQ